MSRFAKIERGKVVDVIVASQRVVNTLEGEWIETFKDRSQRKKFAGKGMIYDRTKDKFIDPQPYPSWTLDSNDDWKSPVDRPKNTNIYKWDESRKNWNEA